MCRYIIVKVCGSESRVCEGSVFLSRALAPFRAMHVPSRLVAISGRGIYKTMGFFLQCT
jgi:hypothetical protein